MIHKKTNEIARHKRSFNPDYKDGLDTISPAGPLITAMKMDKMRILLQLTLWVAGKYYGENYKEGSGRLIRNILPEQ
jgi:hypothetical protein